MEVSLLSHSNEIIDNDEFICLYELNYSNNLDLPYWYIYENSIIENMTDDECWNEFRFNHGDIFLLKDVFRLACAVNLFTVPPMPSQGDLP